MFKKAQGMSINVIIVAIIVLVVLIVLILIFTGYFGSWTKTVGTSCELKGGSCISSYDSSKCCQVFDQTKSATIDNKADCPSGKVCCAAGGKLADNACS